MAKFSKPSSLKLFDAAAAHNVREIRRLLAAGVDPKATTRQGFTAIKFAVERDRNKCLPAVQLLLDAGCPVGRGCLGWPMVTGDAELIHVLVAAGADINAPTTSADSDFGGWTPLARAVHSYGMAERMRKFQKAMGREERTDEEKARWLGIIGNLLAAGADPDGRSMLGTAREIATRDGVHEILALLPKAKKAKPAEKGVVAGTFKPTPFKRAKDVDAGARDFLEFIFKGHPEWAVLIVEAPLEATIKALQKRRKLWHWEKKVAVKSLGKLGPSRDEHDQNMAALSIKGSAWTVVQRSMFELSAVELIELPEDAKSLSKSLKTRAATFMGEDTSGALGYELYERGNRVERIDWSGGVTKFESLLRKQPRWPKDDFDVADMIFGELGVYLPACIAQGDETDEVFVAADKKSGGRIARADVIAL